MQSGSGPKNPPWARSNVNTNMTGMNPQIMDPNAMMTQQGMMQFQQTQAVFNPSMMQAQSGMAMPMAGQMPMNQMAQGQMYPGNVVAYPTPRAMNPGMYQNSQSNQSSSNTEQRVFTGTVTKTHNDFGFVDHDVFYQTSICAKGIIPKVNDRVLVEATFNPNMPFKWNATRVQVLPKTGPNQKSNPPKNNNYNAVPPPANKKSMPSRRDDRPPRRDDRFTQKRSRSRSRSRSRDRRDSRSRRDSPPRKRPVVHQPSPIKYVVRVPRIPLDIQKMDVPALSQRYTNLYVPSDFFNAQVKWGETFPPQTPFSINNPCAYHIMNKEIDNPVDNDAILEPPDADYRFSAKVMLISMPTLEALYQKCGLTKVDEKDKRSSSNKNPLHPTRLIKFLVGQKGKGGENFAIGGPWSPSLDGDNPQSDPKVLVKTAIRTCKALTGIDLSSCTQWYRMVEFYYWREGSGGKSRLECVVLFLPDVWSAQPSRIDWTNVQELYKAACEASIRKLDGEEPESSKPEQQVTAAADTSAADKSQIDKDLDSSTITIDENDDDEEKPEPTHYSKLDLRTIKVDQLRQELRARNVSCKGLRAQLVSRLSKLLKTEESEDKKEGEDIMELEDDEQDSEKKAEVTEKENVEAKEEKEEEKKPEVKVDKKEEEKKEEKVEKEEKKLTEKEIEEEKRKLEKEKLLRKARYEIPPTPHILVHPSNSAKGGKFNCSVATLSLLLDYRITDNKEHSFELFVFAELFNEMLMRDFGFYIYKTLYTLPEKAEEVKEKKEEEKVEKKVEEKKEDKKEEKRDEKKEEKKDDRRDDKRDSRRRDRKESPSDDERSGSPKRRSRGVELPPDPYLLLSLVYFDTSRGGSMTKKDLQNLFMSLGLQLSRSQIRSVLEKVCVKEMFTYKTLIQTIRDVSSGSTDVMQDMPLDTTISNNDVPTHIAELEETIAAGNRNLLPIFNATSEDGDKSSETKDVSESGMVMYKSRLVDVGALVKAEARSAASRARLEGALESTRAALRAARAAAASTQQAERGAQTQVSDPRHYVDRAFCSTCEDLYLVSQPSKKHAKDHRIITPLTDEQLARPTTWLPMLENDSVEAQYMFTKKSVTTVFGILKNNNISNILCIGTPSIHEEAESRSDFNSILLDYDKRHCNFYPPNKFIWYNMFNNYMFNGNEDEKVLKKFFKKSKEGGICIVMDPPFGGRVEPLVQTIKELTETYRTVCDRPDEGLLPVLWAFPYFSEPYITNMAPEIKMHDYQIEYTNHKKFLNKMKDGRKFVSPIRFFTNLPLRTIDLSNDSNYKMCNKCKFYVASSNNHCHKCGSCTSKNGMTYKHCDICKRCVKPTFFHCKECEMCCQQRNHVCGVVVESQSCFNCKQKGHKQSDCPQLQVQNKKKRKSA